jgi:hypothetical protein
MPISRAIIAALASASCLACATTTYDSPNTLGVLPRQPPTPLWLGAMHGSGNVAPVAGAAALTPSRTPGWTHALVSVNDAPVGGIYTWSVRSGNCGAQGSVVGPTERYGQFPIRADGYGAAEAEIPATMSPSGSYAVVATPAVPGATGGAATTVCADLTRGSM